MDMIAAKAKEALKDAKRVEQNVDTLLGQRGADNKPLSALRRGELLPLASQKMKSTQLLAAPTMADFNALTDRLLECDPAVNRYETSFVKRVHKQREWVPLVD